MYRKHLKRLLDFTITLLGFIIISPLFFVVTLILLFANQGNPFFLQKRPGWNSQIFQVIKFKTMNDKKDSHGKLLSDTERLTRVGVFIRKTSLDELPQLLNVIKGDMSLIGPRPLLLSYLPKYNSTQIRRHEVRPGITGWAQVNGRNTLPFSKRLEYDVWYVDNLSFSLDVKILFMTIKKVFTSEGIIVCPYATGIDDLNFSNND